MTDQGREPIHGTVEATNKGGSDMQGRVLGRRELLIAAGSVGAGTLGAVAAGALPQTAIASGRSEDETARIVGSWLVTVTDPQLGQFPVLIAFGGDGTVIKADNVTPPGARATPGFGAWSRSGDGFRFQIVVLFSSSQGSGSGIIRGTATVHDDTISGTSTLEFLDSSGHVISTSPAPQSFKGTRIES